MKDEWAYERQVYEAMHYYTDGSVESLHPASFRFYAKMAHRHLQRAERDKELKWLLVRQMWAEKFPDAPYP